MLFRSAALGYSRQTMERASALERVPSVVGYSAGSTQTFGWVLGPRATITTKGKVNVEQMLRPYDLSVDMSVPAWWPKLTLRISKVWGPSPQQLTKGELIAKDHEETVVEVSMPRRAPDFDWFTQGLSARQGDIVTIERVEGGPVNACSPSTLLVTGRNVWRADKVMVLGQVLEGNAIAIAPDMKGILLTVPAIPPLPGNQVRDASLHVFTPLDRSESHALAYVSAPSGDSCKTKKAEAAVDPNKIVIENISPDLHFSVPAAFDITVLGKNLDKITRVTLHGQAGNLTPSGPERLVISFTPAGTQSIPSQEGAQLQFYKSNGKSTELAEARTVRITRQGGN